jgi:hypothetical protein
MIMPHSPAFQSRGVCFKYKTQLTFEPQEKKSFMVVFRTGL